MFERNRIALFPHGPASDPEARQTCEGLLLHCGADVSRIVDTTPTSLEGFVKSVGCMDGVRDGSVPSIIVLTRTSPVALLVLKLRRQVCTEFPALSQALWVIFVDDRQEPFFQSEAEKLGTFDGPLAQSPIWHEQATDDRYIILTPQTKDAGNLQSQLIKLRRVNAPISRRESSTSLEAVIEPSSRKS